MPAMTAPDLARWKQVVRDCREVDAEEAAKRSAVEDLCDQIVQLPDLHATLVKLIGAVRQYANDSRADTSRVVGFLDDAASAMDDVYMDSGEER